MQSLVTSTRHELNLVDHPLPEPAPGQARIRVVAASVNPVDAMVRDGMFHDLGLIDHPRPLGLGWDLVGVVEAVSGVPDGSIRVGQRVAALLPGVDKPVGALSEVVLVAVSDLAAVPDGLSDHDAAAVGMNALTAAQALEFLGPPAGRDLLVTGAAGGVGGFGVELAIGLGWKVTGLARESDRAFVERRGAHLITELSAELSYDAVLDAAPLQLQDELFTSALVPTLREGATFMSVMGALPAPELPAGRHAAAVFVDTDGPQLSELLLQAASGDITPRIAGTVPLGRAADAFAGLAAAGRGRWLVTPDQSAP